MAKDKERSVNPAQQARKQEKNRALKKAKNEQQTRRNEKLARRNPERVQRQIDDLKALESSGEIKPREKAILADLERDLRAIRKAREALGEKASTFGNAGPRGDLTNSNNSRVLGKRGRDGEQRQRFVLHDQDPDSGGETDESVRAIPMPRDTPPPIPHEFRRHRQHRQQHHHHHHDADFENEGQAPSAHAAQTVEHKTTYSSTPQIRDLQKEATSRFVPSVVKKKQDAIRGVAGGLLEPEEMDRLEAAGYANPGHTAKARVSNAAQAAIAVENSKTTDLEEEETRFQQELAAIDGGAESDRQEESGDEPLPQRPRPRQVQIEDVEDEDW